MSTKSKRLNIEREYQETTFMNNIKTFKKYLVILVLVFLVGIIINAYHFYKTGKYLSLIILFVSYILFSPLLYKLVSIIGEKTKYYGMI